MAGIFAHYVRHTLVTFEETAPPVAAWQARLDELAALGLPFLVARTGGEVAGYAYASPWRGLPGYRRTVTDSVYVAPHRTGQGLGRALLAALLTECARAGMRQVIAVIAGTGDGTSIALHRSFGFTWAGRLTGVGSKHGRWIDTVLMQLDLTTAGG